MDESVQKHIEESLPKVGRFQRLADAMLKGCAVTEPALPYECSAYQHGKLIRACVWMALQVGLGEDNTSKDAVDLRDAYEEVYGCNYITDYEENGFTREQIAARIAAL